MNNQKTLDVFFKTTPNKDKDNITLKKYFYLEWTNNYLPEEDAQILSERPSKINFIQKIDCPFIKKGYYFYICGYFKDYNETSYTIEKESKYTNESYLLSHLQKSIRKQDLNLSIQTCFHLMKLNISSLLRRIPIIMLEDAYLHKSITTIIWLMIALTKKFKMKKYIYEWILGFVYICCKTKKKDKINCDLSYLKNSPTITMTNNFIEILNDVNNVNTISENSLLYSLYFRCAFGGKEHDIEYMQKYIYIWDNRFQKKDKKKINSMIIRPISIYIKELDIDKWDISAIDCHTNSNFIEFISKKFPDINKENIKKMIWINSSSINTRKKHELFMKEEWENIKLYVIKTQKYLLESNY